VARNATNTEGPLLRRMGTNMFSHTFGSVTLFKFFYWSLLPRFSKAHLVEHAV
jgi:hypothetical protein